MRYPDSFAVTLPSDCEIAITRAFSTSPQQLFDAFTKPELVRRWLLGPDGWTMPVCEIDLRVGGTYRYVWRKEGAPDMGISGRFLDIDAPRLIVNTELFDHAWYPGEANNTTQFTQTGATTTVTITVRYQSKEARDTASRSGMEHGMRAGFDRLEAQVLDADSPHVIDMPAQHAAAIHLTIPRSDIQKVMGPTLQELHAVVAAQGITPSGPWFTHHLEMTPDTFNFEVCVPVSAAISETGRVVNRDFPARRVARRVYRGGYEGLSSAWSELMQWIDAQGHTAAPDLFECYVAGPETGAPASEWRTELTRPLV
ncbi:MAG: SRPBCC domain-containing protein [Vicinamibacterales bacterium]